MSVGCSTGCLYREPADAAMAGLAARGQQAGWLDAITLCTM
jgi:hypothetical protein